jgi:DNA-binding NarL/FixJ family response regulator
MGTPNAHLPTRILIADDHALARAGLRAMLAPEPDFAIVGEAATGAEVLRLCAALRPDVVLLDLRMPDLDGLAATRAIRDAFPAIAVVVVTIYDRPDYLRQALQAGAAGYLLKDATQGQLAAAVRAALPPGRPPHPARPAPPERLTAREADVLRLLVRGHTNPEIARTLGVGTGTVRGHVTHILGKLGATNRSEAAVLAIQLGLVLQAFFE